MKVILAISLSVCALLASKPSNASAVTYTNELAWQSATGQRKTIDFEGTPQAVATQYPDVRFSGANGGSPYTTSLYPHEGQNSMFTVLPWNGGGGGWAATFAKPVKAVAFWSSDVEFSGTTISIFDTANALLGSYDLMESGGGHGPFLYGFNGFLSDEVNIARIEVAINRADAIWFDNFQYSSATTPVSAPGTLWLIGAALVSAIGPISKRSKLR